MANSNLKYQNGLRKRDAVRATWHELVDGGVLTPRSPDALAGTFGGRPHFIVDTNVMFALIEYWGSELRRCLRALAEAQPGLRFYLLDTVASECRGMGEKRRLYDEIVYNGNNADDAVVYPLSSALAKVESVLSELAAAHPVARASDRKDQRIAAAALAYDMVVLTRNGADFARLAAQAPALRYIALPGAEAELRLGAELLLAIGSRVIAA